MAHTHRLGGAADKKKYWLLVLVGVWFAQSDTTKSYAATIMTMLTPFEGGAEVRVTMDDAVAGPGKIQVQVDVVANPNIGDLRGLFLHIACHSLVSGLSVSGADVTQSVFGPSDSVANLGGGNNLNGGGTPCGCDIGIEIGTPGMSPDDIPSTTLTLMHSTVPLNISHFASQAVGARATSVGTGSSRTGSSKLSGLFPVPEPTGFAMCLAALPWCLRRRSRRTSTHGF